MYICKVLVALYTGSIFTTQIEFFLFNPFDQIDRTEWL